MGMKSHFADEMRRVREEIGMTIKELADAMGTYKEPSLRSFENGFRTPTVALAAGLDKVFGTHGMFMSLQRRAEEDGSPFGELRESEQRAIAIRLWDTPVIPGLLQTEPYASALLSDPEFSDPNDVIERMERQQIFDRDDPPHVHAIISESALYIEVGGPAVLCAQLEHLIRPDAPWTLQVLPDRADWATAADGPLTLLEFGGDEPPIAFLSSRNGGTVVDDQGRVGEYWRQWDRLTSEALSATLSREMIEAVIRDLSEE